MSFPNIPEKYNQPAVVEPKKVIEERGKLGLNPTCAIPAGAIICYDTVLWNWVSMLPNRVECDGWLKGAFLLPQQNTNVLVMKAAGFGAPTAVMTLEELIAQGVKKIINLGTAGGLQKKLSVGDIVICDRAIRDEGTSHHYLPDEKYAYADRELTEQLIDATSKKNIAMQKGTSWTTDAPYRETIVELKRYRTEGVLTVEMEAAALFAVANYRGAQLSSIFTISDVFTEEGWHQGYYSEKKIAGLQQIFQVALDILVL